MAFVYDKLTDSVDWRIDIYSPAYHQFLARGGDEIGDFDACSVSQSGEYVAGGGNFGDTMWVVKTTPAGSPTKILDQNYDGTVWTGDATRSEIIGHAVDDAGFIWGVPGDPSTGGRIGYIDPANPTAITKAFQYTENGAAGGDVDGFNVDGIFAFTMPDASIRVLVFPSGTDNPYVFDHTKGSGTYTVRDSGGTWLPSWCFQDDNGDLWICGSTSVHPTTEVGFQRITDVTGSSPYTSPQTVTVPSTVTYGSIPKGYFAGGYFIGGWAGDVQDGALGAACGTVFKINLTTGAMTSADFTADPIRFPNNPSPPDPTYYFVFKLSDTNLNHGNMTRVFYHLQTDLTLGTSYNLDSWAAGDEGGNLSGVDDVYTQFWADGRGAFIGQRYQNLDDNGAFDPTGDIIETADLFIYYFGGSGGGGGGDGGGDGLQDTSVRLRVWGYSLDGHDFYVLRVGPSETLVYDLTTNTWAEWASPGRDNWRAHVGQNWIGMSADTLANGFGSDVVAGDDASGVLWILDPSTGRDDRSTTGDDAFNRRVIGGLTLSGREVVPCGALQLDYSGGNPTQSGATFTLEISDDWGNTFDSQGSVTVTADDFAGTVEWRGLGLAKYPGRVFRITDNGAAVRISGANLR